MAQQPGPDDAGDTRPGPVSGGRVRRLELLELQVAKLWELFTRAARLDTSVEALRDEVRFLTSMWQQIHENDAALEATRAEVHAVQREKADTRTVRRMVARLRAAVAVVVLALMVGVGVVWVGVRDVREVARQECVAANGRIQAAIGRERALAETDAPATRVTHLQSATAMTRQLRDCR